MSVLDALQAAAIRLVGTKPQVFFGSSEQLETELCDLVNEVAQDIAQYQDWQALVRTTTLTGNGTTDVFPLPNDYGRMMLTSELQDLPSWAWGYSHYADVNQFLYDQSRGWVADPGGWIIFENQMRFSPAPTGTATFPYITKNIVRTAQGNPAEVFTNDSDDFLLPERVLRLGLIWRWRENKKLDAIGDQEAFLNAIDESGAKDKGPVVFRRRSFASRLNTRWAYPWALGPSTYNDH